MGYSEYLKQMLKPLKIYDLSDGSYNSAELTVLGMALDECCDEAQKLEREAFIPTAEDYGLSLYEEILPRHYAVIVRTRRKAIISMLSVNNGTFTERELTKVLSGCGEPTTVTETGEKMQVIVDFTDVETVPANFNALSKWVESMLPCHLDVIYSCKQS